MTAEKLALKVRNDLNPLLTPALEATLPETFSKILDIIDYCGKIYLEQYDELKSNKNLS